MKQMSLFRVLTHFFEYQMQKPGIQTKKQKKVKKNQKKIKIRLTENEVVYIFTVTH